MGSVIHTGQAIVDVVFNLDGGLPAAGEDVFARSSSMRVGGGFNVMAAASREGARVLYAGGHGTGPLGDLARTALHDDHIDLARPRHPTMDTGFCVAFIDGNAERTFVSTTGAETAATPDALSDVKPGPEDVVYVSGYSLHHEANMAMLAAFLPELNPGTRVVVDASPVIAEVPDSALRTAIAHASIWTANEREAHLLLNRLGEGVRPVESPTDRREAARTLAALLDAVVLIRVGAAGCWFANQHEDPILIPGIEVTAVDTNGAGDAHTGVLCADIAARKDVANALRRANVAAGLGVTRHGPATSPTHKEINAYLDATAQL